MNSEKLIMKKTMGMVLLLLIGVTASARAQERSANEVARELANPNNSLASLTFRNQFRWYTGDLPDADDQSNCTLSNSGSRACDQGWLRAAIAGRLSPDQGAQKEENNDEGQ